MSGVLPIRRFAAAAAMLSLAVALAAPGCRRREGDVACLPGALSFSKPATLVAQPPGTLTDLRVAAVGTDFAVVWSAGPTADDTDLYGRRVNVDGVVSSNEVRITQAAGISTGVRLASGPGGLGVSWSDGRLTQRVAMATVLGGALSPSGTPAVFQSPVIAGDQLPVPAIAVATSGFLVAWNGRGDDGFDHLFAQVLTPAGEVAGAPFPLAAAQEDRATPPSAASTSSGAVVIVDEELRVGVANADVFAYLVAGTAALGSARYGVVSEAKDPEAVGFAGGGGVVWVDGRDAGRTDLFYAPFGGGEIRITEGPESHRDPNVESTGASFLVSWVAGDGEVRVRAFKPDGRPDGSSRVAGSGPRADVAWNGFAAGVVWADVDGGIWFRPLSCQ